MMSRIDDYAIVRRLVQTFHFRNGIDSAAKNRSPTKRARMPHSAVIKRVDILVCLVYAANARPAAEITDQKGG